MNGIYTILLAMYMMYVAVHSNDYEEPYITLKALFIVASILTMVASIVVQVLS